MPSRWPDLFQGVQSAFAPDGPQAGEIAFLTWIMIGGGAIIFLLVMALAAYAILAPQENRRWLADRRMVMIGGIALPIVVLSALLLYALGASARMVHSDPDALDIEVVGERWWWRVRYPDAENQPVLVTANEIHIPAGRPVRLRLISADVIHSFWVPRLAGKLDMIPGRANVFQIEADAPGVYRGQCAEYCGGPHALMAFDVVAETPEAFQAWLAGQRKPAAEPIVPFLARGQELFLSSGCGACHAIRGTPANGEIGPDLTHVGSRRSIAAGAFPNNQGTLAGWISDSQHLKPGNLMPSFNVFEGEDLRAIAAYLESLK